MVWKDNLIVDDEIITYEGFLENFLGYEITHQGFDVFHLPLIYSKNPKDVIKLKFYLDKNKFPQHYFFANFQCLRCGLCCKNYECVPIDRELAYLWILEKRDDLLQFVELYDFQLLPEIYSRGAFGCPMCRKVANKPYYGCKIQRFKRGIPVCKSYLCSKSLPVSDLEYNSIDELIERIGLDGYYSLIEIVWGEDFDYDKCIIKTHKRTEKNV